MFPVELLPELREQIVSFLGIWEIIPLSLTCRQALETVEAYSLSELDRIEREHDVDDTWRFRVGMQAAHDAARTLSEHGDYSYGALLQNNVSHRRMLRSAYRTYLYSLGTTPSHDWANLLALSMHPNGKDLLSGGRGRPGDPKLLRLWDLSTKKCINSFVGHENTTGNPYPYKPGVLYVGFSAGHMVSCEARTLRIWSMNGMCKHELSFEHDVSAFASTNETVYVVDNNGPIYAISTVMGSVRALAVQPWENVFSVQVELHVCRNYLLILRGDTQDEVLFPGLEQGDPPFHHDGVYIIDRDSEQVHSHFAGQYGSMACTDDGDVTLASYNGGIHVFRLVDGHLIPRLSILSHPAPQEVDLSPEVLHMTKTHIFVKDDVSLGASRSRIIVYNTMTGTMERSLYYPTVEHVADTIHCYPTCMVSNEREVFVGFGLQHGVGTHRVASCTIKAFLLR